jgi:hypothetical protein
LFAEFRITYCTSLRAARKAPKFKLSPYAFNASSTGCPTHHVTTTMPDPKRGVKTHLQKTDVRDAPFDNILNFRDVGKTINGFLGKKYFPPPYCQDSGSGGASPTFSYT